MVELLSGSNNIIWVNSYGSLNGPIFPYIYEVKETLTIYHPGLNLLALQSLRLVNERRRLLQVILYLTERDFEPDMVWIDNPLARRFTEHFAKKGARTIYYADESDQDEMIHAERKKLINEVDLVYKPGKLSSGMAEDDFIAALGERLEEIGRLVDKLKV